MSQGIWTNNRTPHSLPVSYKKCILQQLELGLKDGVAELVVFLSIIVLSKRWYNTANETDLCLNVHFGQIKKPCPGHLYNIFCGAFY